MPRPPHAREPEPPEPPHGPPHHRGYYAAFPTEEGLALIEQLFGSREYARAAERILRDCPEEIALVVETVVRVWGDRANTTVEKAK